MKTNTVEQAERLRELGIKGRTGYEILDGPALTLDELHAVFTSTCLLDFYPRAAIECSSEMNYIWRVNGEEFPRTTNHAADWTEILIWLIENKHVMVEQVNNALEGK